MKTPNTLKVEHLINYCGYNVTIEGKHQFMYAPDSKMYFTIWLPLKNGGRRGMAFSNNPSSKDYKLTLREKLNKAIKTHEEAEKYSREHNEWREQFTNLNNLEKIMHSDFAYARIQVYSTGIVYGFYGRSKFSPSGVEAIGSCTEAEWKVISKQAGKTNQYLAPKERW